MPYKHPRADEVQSISTQDLPHYTAMPTLATPASPNNLSAASRHTHHLYRQPNAQIQQGHLKEFSRAIPLRSESLVDCYQWYKYRFMLSSEGRRMLKCPHLFRQLYYPGSGCLQATKPDTMPNSGFNHAENEPAWPGVHGDLERSGDSDQHGRHRLLAG